MKDMRKKVLILTSFIALVVLCFGGQYVFNTFLNPTTKNNFFNQSCENGTITIDLTIRNLWPEGTFYNVDAVYHPKSLFKKTLYLGLGDLIPLHTTVPMHLWELGKAPEDNTKVVAVFIDPAHVSPQDFKTIATCLESSHLAFGSAYTEAMRTSFKKQSTTGYIYPPGPAYQLQGVVYNTSILLSLWKHNTDGEFTTNEPSARGNYISNLYITDNGRICPDKTTTACYGTVFTGPLYPTDQESYFKTFINKAGQDVKTYTAQLKLQIENEAESKK